jgi:hypothetical protein
MLNHHDFLFLFLDGMVFMVHHAVTFSCAFYALQPFLHHYASFYLGISEFSTAILCFYLLFNDKNGLKARFPTTTTLLGVLFAINFVIFRFFLWFYVSYHFWIDMIGLYTQNRIHSHPAYYVYAIGNIGLTLLQLKWLGDIAVGVKETFAPATPSIKGEGGKKTKKNK